MPMLSRVAESIYWMNRQIERAENIARATETTLDMAIEGTMHPGRLWNGLVCTFGDQADFWQRHEQAPQPERVQERSSTGYEEGLSRKLAVFSSFTAIWALGN